jgi:hypothetical protein
MTMQMCERRYEAFARINLRGAPLSEALASQIDR